MLTFNSLVSGQQWNLVRVLIMTMSLSYENQTYVNDFEREIGCWSCLISHLNFHWSSAHTIAIPFFQYPPLFITYHCLCFSRLRHCLKVAWSNITHMVIIIRLVYTGFILKGVDDGWGDPARGSDPRLARAQLRSYSSFITAKKLITSTSWIPPVCHHTPKSVITRWPVWVSVRVTLWQFVIKQGPSNPAWIILSSW